MNGRPYKNGIEKPEEGKGTADVWAAADAFVRKHRRLPANSDIVGLTNVSSGMTAWRRFYGFASKGRPTPEVKRNIEYNDIYMPRDS